MKNYQFENRGRKFKLTPKCLLVLVFVFCFEAAPAHSQGMGMKNHPSPDSQQTLTDQISEIRSKVFSLETALEKKHQGESGRADKMRVNRMGPMGQMQPGGMAGGPMQNMPGMAKPPGGAGPGPKMNAMGPKGTMKPHGMAGGPMRKMPNRTGPSGPMSPGPKMNGAGMMGMKMMGRMNEKPSARLPSSLPGFPGVSHIYHIGSTDFFIDHSDHIGLTVQQKTTLNQIKEQTTLENSTMDRNVQKLEQDLWVLTSSDRPDIKKIDKKIGEIERLKGKMRLAFIRAVGQAARVLSSEQLELLKGM